MKNAFKLWALLFWISNPVHADPDSTTEFLMNDTASMLDLGVLRLDYSLGELVHVSYGWDDDRITISTLEFSAPDDQGTADTKCDLWMNDIRRRAGVLNGAPLLNDYSEFTRFFTHNGYSVGAPPTNLRTEIDKKIFLSYKLIIVIPGGKPETYTCAGELLSSGHVLIRSN